MKITRRGVFFGSLAVIGAGIGASFLACRPGATNAALAPDPERLRLALEDIIAPERVARAYRTGRSERELVREFAAKPGLVAAADQSCPATMRAHLKAQVQEDFRRGDIVLADRFVVARSECILAALAA